MMHNETTEKHCTNCGTIGCGHQDALRCAKDSSLWTPRKQPPQKQDYETHTAIKEAHHIHASDKYFKARPQIDNQDRRKVFEAGFMRGYDATTKREQTQ